ncbi:ATP-binding response regulator [Desulfogranum marinum]|uniref:ATP-binding response regulator n=1 Tax=Desulfogranum marinum TaxID=453220 RepID=UPI001965C10B|nr:ATP-binding protein [Desulfogranum marinum]MBM9514891.1 response regulator [Desulfogranum marinum]
MNSEQNLLALYDMALIIAGEVNLQRLTRSFLQRLLYHTGFAAGLLIQRDSESDDMITVQQALGGHGLRQYVGQRIDWPNIELLFRENALLSDIQVPAPLQRAVDGMPHVLCLQAGGQLTFFLFTHALPDSAKLLVNLFSPILERFSHAYKSCLQAELQHEALFAAKNEADRANRTKSEFLANMSHELRTPMHAILGFNQLILSEEMLSEDSRDYAREVLKAGQHLLSLVNELLDLSKIESGHLTISPEQVDVVEICKECLTMIDSCAVTQNIGLCRLGCETGMVHADRTKLKQVILNVLSNAVKYNRPGGRVNLIVENRDQWVRIAIVDTGIGISASRCPEVFQPFNRLGAEQSTVQGTGIGLTISQRLMAMMGGWVEVESEVGVGSCFTLVLPSSDNDQMAENIQGNEHVLLPPFERTPEAASVPFDILYIEDNPGNVKLMEKIVKQRPEIVLHWARVPEQGLWLANALKPDVILLDINLPNMDGYEVLSRVRASELCRSIPVVAVSAGAQPADIDRGLQAGFSEYLSKPLDVAKFWSVIDKIQTTALCQWGTKEKTV